MRFIAETGVFFKYSVSESVSKHIFKLKGSIRQYRYFLFWIIALNQNFYILHYVREELMVNLTEIYAMAALLGGPL